MWLANNRSNGADVAIAGDFQRFLDRGNERPFLFVASFNNPHNICEAARNGPLVDGAVPDGSPEDYPALPENFAVPAGEPSALRIVQEMYRDRNYPTADWDETRWRKHRWVYARICENLDARIADVLDVLRRSGRAEDTLIVFTSDHGDGNGHHHWNQKQTLYDETARIPFMVAGPMVPQNGHADGEHLVSMGLDLIPTLCDYAGIVAPEHLAGHSVRPVVEDTAADNWRDHVVIETEFGTFGKSNGIRGRAVRSGRFKYVIYSVGPLYEGLYDMQGDPGEMVNLANDLQWRDALQNHREMLLAWARQTADVFDYAACGLS
jgi:arylsulfatase A-like enzyme